MSATARLRGQFLAPAVLVLLAGCGAPHVERTAELARFRAELSERTAALGLPSAKPLALADCERLALENNLDYRVRRLALNLQDDQVRLTMAGWLPQLQADWTQTRRNNKPLVDLLSAQTQMEDQGQRHFGFRALIPIFDFGATYYAWQIAKDRRAQERLLVLRARQTLLRDVRVAYVRHASELRQLALWEQAVQVAREVVRVAKSYQREGLNAPADTAQAEAALAQAERELSWVRRRVEETGLLLKQHLALPSELAVRIDSALPAMPAAVKPEEAKRLCEGALHGRPELWVQDLQQHVAATEVRRELAGFFPRLDAILNADYTSLSLMVNKTYVTMGYNVASSLLDSGARVWRYNLAKKALPVEAERALLVAFGVLYDVDLRLLQLAKAQDGAAASDRLVGNKEVVVKLLQSRFREGFEPSAEVARVVGDYLLSLLDQERYRTDSLVAWHELVCAAAQDTPATISPAAGATKTAPPPVMPRPSGETTAAAHVVPSTAPTGTERLP